MTKARRKPRRTGLLLTLRRARPRCLGPLPPRVVLGRPNQRQQAVALLCLHLRNGGPPLLLLAHAHFPLLLLLQFRSRFVALPQRRVELPPRRVELPLCRAGLRLVLRAEFSPAPPIAVPLLADHLQPG